LDHSSKPNELNDVFVLDVGLKSLILSLILSLSLTQVELSKTQVLGLSDELKFEHCL